jgi:hypothetical protein
VVEKPLVRNPPRLSISSFIDPHLLHVSFDPFIIHVSVSGFQRSILSLVSLEEDSSEDKLLLKEKSIQIVLRMLKEKENVNKHRDRKNRWKCTEEKRPKKRRGLNYSSIWEDRNSLAPRKPECPQGLC